MMYESAVLTVERDLNRQWVTCTLVVDAVALADVRLDEVDRRLLRECDDGSIADKLLALEMLVRRMEQTCVLSQELLTPNDRSDFVAST